MNITVEADLQEKQRMLFEYLRGLGSVAVAFSGGVDSTFLLYAAKSVLGDRAAAITAVTDVLPGREDEEAAAFCHEHGIRRLICRTDVFAVEGFKENPKNRCYLCKKALFSQMRALAQAEGFSELVEGSNMDDSGDYRPGLLAIKELGVKSPLREACLTKADIRVLSRQMGLPTWDKPSYACLASRFVYGEEITGKKLSMVEHAEQLLYELGFRGSRVRIHGLMARIELQPSAFERIIVPEVRERIAETLKREGFTYVSLDLEGYKTGSMNLGITE